MEKVYMLRFEKGSLWYLNFTFKTKKDVWGFLHGKSSSKDDINSMRVKQLFWSYGSFRDDMPTKNLMLDSLVGSNGKSRIGRNRFYKDIDKGIEVSYHDYQYPSYIDEQGDVLDWETMSYNIYIDKVNIQ